MSPVSVYERLFVFRLRLVTETSGKISGTTVSVVLDVRNGVFLFFTHYTFPLVDENGSSTGSVSLRERTVS